MNGNARFTAGGPGPGFNGTVGSQGELVMRRNPEPVKLGITPGERIIFGRIDGGGTIRARRIGNGCNYDLIWQKQSQ